MVNELLKSYADAMIQAAGIVNDESPDFLVAPMLGSVPFIDAMAIVDDNFDASRVVYMPASSRIRDVNRFIEEWYFNFLSKNVIVPHNLPRILGIDEVVSGASVMRCFKFIDAATIRKRRELRQSLVEKLHSKDVSVAVGAVRDADLLTDNDFAYELSQVKQRVEARIYPENKVQAKEDTSFFKGILKNKLDSELVYRTIGIEDAKGKIVQNEGYREKKTEERVIPVHVDAILTMDSPDYCPVRLKTVAERNGKKINDRFLPVVEDFVITREYSEFLRALAKYVGKNPDNAYPVNMKSIFDAHKYLSSVESGSQ